MGRPTNTGTIPCLVCGNEYEYLTTTHMGTHPPGYPQSDPDYWEWAAEKWGVSVDDVPLDPSGWRESRELFPGWRDDAIDVE